VGVAQALNTKAVTMITPRIAFSFRIYYSSLGYMWMFHLLHL